MLIITDILHLLLGNKSMTRLETLLATITDLSDAADVLKRITAKAKRVVVYEGLQTISAFTKAYGADDTATLLYTIETALASMRASGDLPTKVFASFVDVYSQKFVQTGLDLSDVDVQASLDRLVPVIGQEYVDKLKRLGAYYISDCNTAGIDEPTLDEVTTAVKVVLESHK